MAAVKEWAAYALPVAFAWPTADCSWCLLSSAMEKKMEAGLLNNLACSHTSQHTNAHNNSTQRLTEDTGTHRGIELSNHAVAHDQDAVTVHDCVQAVRNGDRRAVAELL